MMGTVVDTMVARVVSGPSTPITSGMATPHVDSTQRATSRALRSAVYAASARS